MSYFGEDWAATELREDIAACLERLASTPRCFLRDLPALDVPRLPGIYALWFEDELLYVGIARKDPALRTTHRRLVWRGGSQRTATAA
jgi:hypothetical protein